MPLSTLITQPISYSLPFKIKSIIDYIREKKKNNNIQIDAATTTSFLFNISSLNKK